MYNYKLQIQYDGGRYDGWQRMGKDSSSNTIEAKIKEIISKMTGEDIDIYVGCRTEKGVHALAQTANFKLNDKYQPVEITDIFQEILQSIVLRQWMRDFTASSMPGKRHMYTDLIWLM